MGCCGTEHDMVEWKSYQSYLGFGPILILGCLLCQATYGTSAHQTPPLTSTGRRGVLVVP